MSLSATIEGQLCMGEIHCDANVVDPGVQWASNPTPVSLELPPGSSPACAATSFWSAPEGEGEGEGGEGEGEGDVGEGEGEGELWVEDYVDGQWITTVVSAVDVHGTILRPPATAADLDDDGVAEVLFTDPRGVHLVRGLMSATPSQELLLPTDMWTDGIRELDLEDLDGDGAKDLLVVASESAGLRLLRGLGGGAFADPVDLLIAPPGMPNVGCSVVNGVEHCFYDMHQASLADLDGDGDLDIVAAGPTLNVLRNDGDLAFTPVAALGALPLGAVTYAMYAATAWRDGDVARIVAAGRWSSTQSGIPDPEGAMFALVSTDLASWTVTDGVPANTYDTELRLSRTLPGQSGDVVACGRGTRLVAVDASGALVLGPSLGYCPRQIGDFEGDGDLDMLTDGFNQGVLLGDGAGTWTALPSTNGVPLEWASTWGDLDGDGMLELILIL
ncbi:MAG: VCBS repeat-containing protein [Deltaproteobacteria bacterium]|nr:VCBS repeat-containing protein [Deltaproteobacteria bacterium]